MPFRSYLPTPGNFAFRRASDELDQFVTDLIERRHREGNPTGRKDILDRIIAGLEEAGVPWNAEAVAQLRDEVKTFLMAGHETSSMMLTWALYELVRHPHAMERTIAEANQTIPRGVPSSQEIALKGLEYTEAVLRESLRRYSLVPVVTREAVADDELGGFEIKKGSKIVVAIDAIHHDEKLWPDPTAFKPERFLQPLPHPYAFLAFLAGPRNCIGEHFSIIEAKLVLARLVQRFRFHVASKEVGERHMFKAPVAPAQPMHLFVEEHVRREVRA
jgi:cytochrome P450